MTGAERIIESATYHGEQSDPDHEIGDLQQAVRALWLLLTPKQKALFNQQYWEQYKEWK